MSFQIAIPSYKRPGVARDATLATLRRHKVDLDNVTIYVASPEQKEIYEEQISDVRIVVGVLGKVRQIRFYHSQYPVGSKLVSFDDDVYKMRILDSDGKFTDFKENLDDLFALGYELCERNGARLWGVNPTGNDYFMKNSAAVGLRYIIGTIYGAYAGDDAIVGGGRVSDESSGDDYETTLRSFMDNGSVIRIENVSYSTKYFAIGGIDAEIKDSGKKDRMPVHYSALENIASCYPELAKVTVKARGVKNIRLKNLTKTYIPLDGLKIA
jgi:hypothetical protein